MQKNHNKVCWNQNKNLIVTEQVTLGKIRKQRAQKKCLIKRKLKFDNYKNCLEATQLENKTDHLEKIKLTSIVLKKIIKHS